MRTRDCKLYDLADTSICSKISHYSYLSIRFMENVQKHLVVIDL